MASLGEVIPWVLGSGAVTWTGNAGLQWLMARGERAGKQADAKVQLDQHTDKFAIDLMSEMRAQLAIANAQLEAVKADLSAANQQNVHVAHLERQIGYLEEALDHIESLIRSEAGEGRKDAERRAAAFVRRMRALAESRILGMPLRAAFRGTAEAQTPPDMQDKLDKLE